MPCARLCVLFLFGVGAPSESMGLYRVSDRKICSFYRFLNEPRVDPPNRRWPTHLTTLLFFLVASFRVLIRFRSVSVFQGLLLAHRWAVDFPLVSLSRPTPPSLVSVKSYENRDKGLQHGAVNYLSSIASLAANQATPIGDWKKVGIFFSIWSNCSMSRRLVASTVSSSFPVKRWEREKEKEEREGDKKCNTLPYEWSNDQGGIETEVVGRVEGLGPFVRLVEWSAILYAPRPTVVASTGAIVMLMQFHPGVDSECHSIFFFPQQRGRSIGVCDHDEWTAGRASWKKAGRRRRNPMPGDNSL